jgi:hypothetical protein
LETEFLIVLETPGANADLYQLEFVADDEVFANLHSKDYIKYEKLVKLKAGILLVKIEILDELLWK